MVNPGAPLIYSPELSPWVAASYEDCWLTFLNSWVKERSECLGLSRELFWDTTLTFDPLLADLAVAGLEAPPAAENKRTRTARKKLGAPARPQPSKPIRPHSFSLKYYQALAKALGLSPPSTLETNAPHEERRLLRDALHVAEAIRHMAISLCKGKPDPHKYRENVNLLKVVQVPRWPVVSAHYDKNRVSGGHKGTARYEAAVLSYLNLHGTRFVDGELTSNQAADSLTIGPNFDIETTWQWACYVGESTFARVLYAGLRCIATDLLVRVQPARTGLGPRQGHLSRCKHTADGEQCSNFLVKVHPTQQYCDDHLANTRTYKAASKARLYPGKKRKWDRTRGNFDARVALILELRPRLAAKDAERMRRAAVVYLQGEPVPKSGRPRLFTKKPGQSASYAHFCKYFGVIHDRVAPSTL